MVPKQYGTMHRGDGERGAEVAAVAGAEHGLAEREARAAQHDPERGERERHEQGEGDRLVGLGEAGPQHDEAEDQPHVVGLPDRGDGVVDVLAGAFAALGAAGDEVPEPGAEVGAAEHGVGGDGDEQHDGDDGAHDTVTSSRSRDRRRRSSGGGGAEGPYGTSSSPTSRSRNRLDILRRIRMVVTPEPDVEGGDEQERDPHAGVAGGGVLDLHQVVDDPRLAADLGHDPAGLHRDHRRHPGARGQEQEQLGAGEPPPEDPRQPVPRREQEQQGARARPSGPRPGGPC